MNHIKWNAYAQAELSSYCLNTFSIDEEKVIKEFADNIERVTLKLKDPETWKKRHDFFAIKRAVPQDYDEHVIDLGEGREAIVGIRFFGLDINKPFLSVRTNFLMENTEILRERLLRNMEDRFAMFSPRYIQVFTPKPLELASATSVVMLGKMSEVDKLETNIFIKQVQEDEDYYPWYEDQYKSFHVSRPDLKENVTINSKELMDESRETGLLYKAYIGPNQIGLIAGERADFLGRKSLYMNEIVIGEEHKNKGYAKIMQRNFMFALKDEFDFVFGTIHPKNLPSMKTALSNGRVPVQYESLVKI